MVLGGPESPLPPQTVEGADSDEALIDAVAGRVVRMGLGVPAIFFLESTKPLSYVGSQALVFLEPFIKTFLTVNNYNRFVAMLEDRSNIEKLILRIEDLDEEARVKEDQRKKREREEAKARRIADGRPTFRQRLAGVFRRRDRGERNGRG